MAIIADIRSCGAHVMRTSWLHLALTKVGNDGTCDITDKYVRNLYWRQCQVIYLKK